MTLQLLWVDFETYYHKKSLTLGTEYSCLHYLKFLSFLPVKKSEIGCCTTSSPTSRAKLLPRFVRLCCAQNYRTIMTQNNTYYDHYTWVATKQTKQVTVRGPFVSEKIPLIHTKLWSHVTYAILKIESRMLNDFYL